jgi:hypothetical protein
VYIYNARFLRRRHLQAEPEKEHAESQYGGLGLAEWLSRAFTPNSSRQPLYHMISTK